MDYIAHKAPPSMESSKDTGVGCHFLLQEIFLIQGSDLSLLHWQADSLPLSHQGSPKSLGPTPKFSPRGLSFSL